jgi:glycosyltransferase involved in cell wall biosynthesis
MTIYHIELSKAGTGLSGGEVVMLEIVRELALLDINNVIITTDNGEAVYRKYLGVNNRVKYSTLNSYRSEKRFGILISYFLRTFYAKQIANKLHPKTGDTFICHSEFMPSSVMSYFFSRNKNIKDPIYFFHMFSPSIFKGYSGEFTNKKTLLISPRIIFYKLNQWLYRKITPRSAKIITVNPYYKKRLQTLYKKNELYVLRHHGGYRLINNASHKKDYDLLWVGRFHTQKGMLEIPDILKLVQKTLPTTNLAILGNGDQNLEKKLKKKIQQYGLADNIDFVGFADSKEKANYYSRSKIFMMTSYFESFGVVNFEALTAGIPVVAYDLPVFEVFDGGMIKVPILDNVTFAQKIIKLLSDPYFYKRMSKDAKTHALSRSWELEAKEILDIINAPAKVSKAV